MLFDSLVALVWMPLYLFARFHEAEHAKGWMGGVADNFRGVGDKYPVVLNTADGAS